MVELTESLRSFCHFIYIVDRTSYLPPTLSNSIKNQIIPNLINSLCRSYL